MTRISRVVPAILTSDPEALRAMVRRSEEFASYVQIDIMDGRFVPSLSVTDNDLDGVDIKVRWEAHLMVEEPSDRFAGFQKYGASKVIFHYEATSSPKESISRARQLSLEVGMAVNPDTSLSSILPLVNDLDSILFMTVQPGFYGSKFQPQVMDKITEFRRRYPVFKIGVDGGVSESNIALIASAGVDDICVGSAIFLRPSPGESFRHLQKLAEEASRRPATAHD